jgi:hypothetical protein
LVGLGVFPTFRLGLPPPLNRKKTMEDQKMITDGEVLDMIYKIVSNPKYRSETKLTIIQNLLEEVKTY